MSKHFEKHLSFLALSCFFVNRRHQKRMESIRTCSIIHHNYPKLRIQVKVGERVGCPHRWGVVFLTKVFSFQRWTKQCPSVLFVLTPLTSSLGQNPRINRQWVTPTLKPTELMVQPIADIWGQVNHLTFNYIPLEYIIEELLVKMKLHTVHFWVSLGLGRFGLSVTLIFN